MMKGERMQHRKCLGCSLVGEKNAKTQKARQSLLYLKTNDKFPISHWSSSIEENK